LDRAREEFDAAGVKLVLIGQATPRHAAHFRRRHGLELAVLADERRESYKAAGAKIGSVGELLGPGVVARGILTSARTRKLQGRVIGNAAQLGGAMLILPDGTIAWSHMAKDAADNAAPDEILGAVHRLG
jgi:prostamide/prostaglandin F2alpha synthase